MEGGQAKLFDNVLTPLVGIFIHTGVFKIFRIPSYFSWCVMIVKNSKIIFG